MKKFTHLCLTCIFILSFLTSTTLAQQKIKANRFDAFIPGDCRIMDMASADLNNDSYADYVLVLQSINETWNENEARPLLIIMGAAKGKLSLVARNDSIVLCKNGGGVFGDPYKGICLKNGYVTIEHSVGASWKWNRIISFTYDQSIKEFVLLKDADISYHISDPNKQNDILYNKEYYNQLLICHYTNKVNR
jgi:hypothetical protein